MTSASYDMVVRAAMSLRDMWATALSRPNGPPAPPPPAHWASHPRVHHALVHRATAAPHSEAVASHPASVCVAAHSPPSHAVLALTHAARLGHRPPSASPPEVLLDGEV
ncbi:hypothetical protein THAOC_06144, partial [Thalassiosira oceanica]